MFSKKQSDIELEFSQKWYKDGIYSFDKSQSKDAYYIDTPPPTVSGVLHMGHVFSYVQADIIARYKRMRGSMVYYPIGFDDNGLPTERLVEKTLGVKVGIKYSKSSIEKIASILPNFKPLGEVCTKDEFVQICLKVVEDAEKDFENLFKTIALSVDWNLKYQTISKNTQTVSHHSFIDLYNKGLIYKKHSPVYWDIADKTALAQADIEDKELQSNELVLNFYSKDLNQNIQIMTTRPEMLPACVCVFYHPNDERYSSALKGKSVIVPIFGHSVPLIADEEVKIDKGTGLVMCCTYGDMQDAKWIKKHSLNSKCIITDDGRVSCDTFKTTKENGEGTFLPIEEARKLITSKLLEDGFLVGKTEITHSVKCGERSGRPIEILEKEQWYISIMPFKQHFLEAAQKITFYPDHMKLRLMQWIEGLNQDWCISRDRFFGIKIPVRSLAQQTQDGPKKVGDTFFVGTDEFFENNEAKIIDEAKDRYDETQYSLLQNDKVLDTWFTSSISPSVAWGDLMSTPIFDLRPQAHEIIRTWAFYTIAKYFLHSITLKNKDKTPNTEAFNPSEYFSFTNTKNIPWKGVMISGWCLASDKTKMSKSKGNIITPLELIQSKGVDVIRFWCSNSSLGADTAYSEALLDKGAKFVTKLKNCANFVFAKHDIVKNIQNKTDFVTNPIDKWILAKLAKAVTQYEQSFANLEYFNARNALDDFFWNDFCDNYLEIIKIRYYGLEANALKDSVLSDSLKDKVLRGQVSCLCSLLICMEQILKLYAPFTPYITDYLFTSAWGNLGSIHSINSVKDVFTYKVNEDIIHVGEKAKQLISEVRKYKSENKIALNATIESYQVTSIEKDDLSKVLLHLKDDIYNVTSVQQFV